MSAIRQAVRDKSPDCRKSAALRNALAENPRALTRPTTASRADSSSSIMEIGRFTDAHTFRCLGCWPRCGRPCGAHAGRSCAMERMGKIDWWRSEEHTSELQSLMRISYAVFCLKNKTLHPYTLHLA